MDLQSLLKKPDNFTFRVTVFRVMAAVTLFLGFNYIIWRYMFSLNWKALWFAIPLLAAETYSFINTVLFVFMLWKPASRPYPPPLEEASVDVFITTYNEPVDIVRLTAKAALAIEWSRLKVYVLDDGARREMRDMAAGMGCGYITRGEEWSGKPLHAKAGNINNALMRTDSEFILVLDADQIPDPRIIRRIIGYFREPKVAFVQTPQHFYNLPPGDPFGSDASLFYGPIMQGKDGWNAAFFCGSNAVLRREALLQIGLTDYVREMDTRFHKSLKSLEHTVTSKYVSASNCISATVLRTALEAAHGALHEGKPLEKVSDIIKEGIELARENASRCDMVEIADTLRHLAEGGDTRAGEARRHILDNLAELARRAKSDIRSLGLSKEVVDSLDLTRPGEAQPILPMATISITEDMATAMRLHALGWHSIFHPEILAYGLAPEDLRSVLGQRLRWAQGTIQVMLRENPLFKKGLNLAQRVQYFTTMYSYFSGFSSLVFLLSPVLFLLTGISPVSAWSLEFFLRIIPFLVINKLMLLYVARGLNIRRSEQYQLSLFPLWIRALLSVVLGKKISFVVTPKEHQSGHSLPLVWPQIAVSVSTVIAMLFGIYSLARGLSGQLLGILMNVFWGGYNIAMLWSIVRAAIYRLPKDWKVRPPAFLISQD